MSLQRFIKFLLLLLVTVQVHAFTELDFDYGYNKNVFGAKRQSYDTTTTYSGSVTFYFLTLTGIEFNVSQSKNLVVGVYDNSGISTGLVIDHESTNITVQSFGIGIRQALAPRGSFIQPLVSLGWSRQRYILSSSTLVKDLDTATDIRIDSGEEKSVYDAMFAAFALKFKVTKYLSLKGSVKSVFRAFAFDEARDQLSYSAGISWIF